MKKILSLFLVFCLTFICSLSSFAASELNSIPEKPVNFGNPVEVRTYYDEESKSNVTERIYFVPTKQGATLRDKSGAGWYKNEKEILWNNSSTTATTYYVKGYFKWGDGKVSVSSATKGFENLPSSAKVSNESFDYGTDRYAGIGSKNAYIRWSFRAKTPISLSSEYSILLRVSENGNLI